jgi:hypothetical protein
MQNARENGHDIDDWTSGELAADILAYDPEYAGEDKHTIEKCVLIWRQKEDLI